MKVSSMYRSYIRSRIRGGLMKIFYLLPQCFFFIDKDHGCFWELVLSVPRFTIRQINLSDNYEIQFLYWNLLFIISLNLNFVRVPEDIVWIGLPQDGPIEVRWDPLDASSAGSIVVMRLGRDLSGMGETVEQ